MREDSYYGGRDEAVAESGKKSLGAILGSILVELQRRKVVQTTTFYLVAAWGLSAGAADIFGALGLPEWAARYMVIGVFALTPLVAAISWFYEVDKRGVYRDYGPPDEQVSKDTAVVRRDRRPPLTLRYGGQSETFYRDVVVGRDDSCGFQIVEPLVSRRHAKFEFIEGRWRVRDLGSANGTILDGREVDSAWLKGQSAIILYPDGPALQVTIARGARPGEETQVAAPSS